MTGRRRVLMAMSGGVDSSVAAALALEAGHEVVGVTMKLWAGASDTGCCSVADVDDARRVAQQLGIDHVVFNFSDEFDRHVVDPYVAAHRDGVTPNPCVECNRHLKFAHLRDRALQLGFDTIATGHHCSVAMVDGRPRVGRGADPAKDQSYVVHMLSESDLVMTLFPVGHLTKAQVRDHAARLGLRTASKPDSQDVCFITAEGRSSFLGQRIELRPGRMLDRDGTELGTVDAVELVTIGQRRGLGLGGNGERRYVTGIDVAAGTVTVGPADDLLSTKTPLVSLQWVGDAEPGSVRVQVSAHGRTASARVHDGTVHWDEPQRQVAPGQSVVFYDAADRFVLGGAIAAS